MGNDNEDIGILTEAEMSQLQELANEAGFQLVPLGHSARESPYQTIRSDDEDFNITVPATIRCSCGAMMETEVYRIAKYIECLSCEKLLRIEVK